jgi:hypothetical protein
VSPRTREKSYRHFWHQNQEDPDYAVTAEMTVWILIERRSGGVSRWSHWPIDVRLFDRSMDAQEFSPRLTKAQSLSG